MVDPIFFDNCGPFSLGEIEKISGARVYNEYDNKVDLAQLIGGVAPLELADSTHITVLNNPKYLNALSYSKAAACFIERKYSRHAPKGMVLLYSDNPYKSYALTSAAFYPNQVKSYNNTSTMFEPKQNLDYYRASSSQVNSTAIIGSNTRIEHGVVIGMNVVIGNNCMIGANTVIGRGVTIGNNCSIGPLTTIMYAIIGEDVMIHTGVRIGQDGFGFASDKLGHYKIPQLGRVIIGNHVEIGSNSCIDRGSGHDTIIGDHCMIDNLVQIGHNVELGKGCVIVAQVGIAGSTKLGDFVLVGGQVGISGHLNIGAMSQIAAQSGVIRDVDQGTIVGGYPAVPIKQWHRQTSILRKLTKLQESKQNV
ncbi:MAG: UDP-3-O-(3-hydroxymyristoyl)glucosamine N-acyltransferase [Rickettsiales endosymbiont of Dermacentor nuttalli]